MSYRELLHEILFTKDGNTQRASRKLYQLLSFILEEYQKTRNPKRTKDQILRLASPLKSGFRSLSIRCNNVERGELSFSEFFLIAYQEYMARMQNLVESIQLLDSYTENEEKVSLVQTLQSFFMQQALDISLEAYMELCGDYISGNKKCKRDLLLIHDVIYQYIILNIDEASFRRSPFVQRFFNMGAIYMQAWVSNSMKRDFVDIYRTYRNTLDLLAIINQEKRQDSGFKLMFDNDIKSFLNSLNNIVLQADVINFLDTFTSQSDGQRTTLFKDYFKEVRPIIFMGNNFDQLLVSIILSDYFKANVNVSKNDTCLIQVEMRTEFEKSIQNAETFHKELLCYLDKHFKNDFKRRKGLHSATASATDVLWVNAMSSLIVYYIPKRSLFLKRFLREGLFRQMLMLNTKFPSFYEDANSLEHSLIHNINEAIPSDMYFIRRLLESGTETLKDVSELDNCTTKLNRLYVSKQLADELSLPSGNQEEPLWPTKELKKQWQKEMLHCRLQGKKLHGLFMMHVVSVSTPIRLPNGRKLTLLCDLTAASILYQFNEYDNITQSNLIAKLRNKDVALSLHRLLECEVLTKSQMELKINESFQAPPEVSRSGILRII